jgi:ribonuclease Z
VSATHIEIPGHGGVLLDAGESTLGQLSRLYGPTGAVDLIRNLKVIFISHLHADHHSGVVNVLRFRTQVRRPHTFVAKASDVWITNAELGAGFA